MLHHFAAGTAHRTQLESGTDLRLYPHFLVIMLVEQQRFTRMWQIILS
ncbi:MAG: hypothetical protein ACJA0X_002268 [Cyclobacteriaceae bacterium]|jgi:hypothetical protein